jgi:8-oxo-dGTP diphosphatase
MQIGHTDFEDFNGLLLPTKDNCATQHIRKKQRLDWDEEFNNIAEIQTLLPGQVVFDVGAYIGDTTRTFLRRGCEVHAFEPRPDNFFCLLNNCQDAHCYNVALGDGERYVTDVRCGNMGAYSLLPGRRYSIRIDSMGVDKLDFLKIDHHPAHADDPHRVQHRRAREVRPHEQRRIQDPARLRLHELPLRLPLHPRPNRLDRQTMNPSYCLGFLFSKSRDRVVLIKKTKPDWQAGKLNGIGGKIEDNESSVEAMVREFAEETGLHVPEEAWTRVGDCRFDYHRDDGGTTVHIFAAVGDWLTQVPRRDCSEGKVGWIFWDSNTERTIMPNLRWLVPLCRIALDPAQRETFRLFTPSPV